MSSACSYRIYMYMYLLCMNYNSYFADSLGNTAYIYPVITSDRLWFNELIQFWLAIHNPTPADEVCCKIAFTSHYWIVL